MALRAARPALVLRVVRQAFGRRLEPRLARLEAWLTKRTAGASAWVIGIIGVLTRAERAGHPDLGAAGG